MKQRSDGQFDLGLLQGTLLGFVLAISLALTLEYLTPNVGSQLSFVERFQTLITGLIAVGIGLLTVRHMGAQTDAIRDQVEEGRRQHEFLLAQRFRAARSALPQELSELCSYAEWCARYLKDNFMVEGVDPRRFENELQVGALKPTMPTSVSPLFRELISNTTRADLILKLEHILRETQVLSARLDGLFDEDRGRDRRQKSWVEQIALDAIELYAQASSLFDFARFDSDEVPGLELTAERVRSAANKCGLTKGYDSLHKTIAKRFRAEEANAELR